MKRILYATFLICIPWISMGQTIEAEAEAEYKIAEQYQMSFDVLKPIIDGNTAYEPFSKYVKYGVKAYKIQVQSVLNGEPVILSGSILVPAELKAPTKLVLYCHGTSFEQNLASSWTNPLHVQALWTMNGYITFIPDYFGYGVSSGKVPVYFLKEETVRHQLDFVHQSMAALQSLNIEFLPELHVIGFSQGGHAALSIAEFVSRHGIKAISIGSAVSIAGPTSVVENLRFLLEKKEPSSSNGYLTYILGVYNAYKWKIDSHEIFKSPYWNYVDEFIAGQIALRVLRDKTPPDIDALMNPSFVEQIEKPPYLNTFEENSIQLFKSDCPILFVHSRSDEDVPFEMVNAFHEALKKENGTGKISLQIVTGSHNMSGLFGMMNALDFINEVDTRDD